MFFERLSKMLSDVFHPRPKYITVTPVTSAPVQALPPSRLPRHVAIIMDGNGRWAQSRGMARSAGHAAGTEALRDIIRASDDWGIEALSLYAFSTENWARSKEEINALMALLLKYFASEIDELDEKNVRITILGDIDGLPAPQREAVVNARERTKANTGLKLNIALNYGGRAELTRAARRLAEKVKAGTLEPEAITEEALNAELYTVDSPDVDLLIRTSGEMRTSNFLPWQTVYAEMVFDNTLWPDFDRNRYMKCLQIYAERERRFGGVGPAVNPAPKADTRSENSAEETPDAKDASESNPAPAQEGQSAARQECDAPDNEAALSPAAADSERPGAIDGPAGPEVDGAKDEAAPSAAPEESASEPETEDKTP